MLKLLSANNIQLIKSFTYFQIHRNTSNISRKYGANRDLLSTWLPTLHNFTRNTSFFNKLPAEQIWKGIISVSNAGKKRGRGKGSGRKTAKDLNRGQIIGVGKANIVWPGLSAPIIRGRELVQQQQLPEDKDREAKLRKLRDEMVKFKHFKISPLERGWSGNKMPGRSIGPPDKIGEDEFEGFDTKVLELKAVAHMEGNMGRKRRIAVMVVTGNGKGLAGFGLGKALESKAAVRMAKNRAGQKLMYIELCNGHTVFHDFYCQFGKTKIFVMKRPEGHGLKCHRAIRTICEVLGIRDLRAKIEGAICLQHIVKAFFIGLLQMKNHESIAQEKGLHIVEFRRENANFPKIVASPTVCRKEEELQSNEILDFTQYNLQGRIVLKKKKFPIFYTKLPHYEIYLRKQEYLRNQDKVRLRMLAEEGEVKSFYTDKYPECRMKNTPPPEGE